MRSRNAKLNLPAYREGTPFYLTKIDDQQNTINRCQEEAIKRIVPEPERHSVVEVYPMKAAEASTVKTYIFTTNRVISPATVTVQCDRPVQNLQGFIAGTTAMVSSVPTQIPNSLARNTWVFSIASPSWSPETPIVIEYAYSGTANPDCAFQRR
jgi:hypothetical protein